MPFVIADRVRETSTTAGTVTFVLDGAITGYQTFDAVLDSGDTTYYTIAEQNGPNWEVGIGTFTAPGSLARTTILSSSNGGSIVSFGSGTKDVFISLPASRTVQSVSGGSTGLTPSTSSFGEVTLAGTLAVGSGGTGATVANTARTNLGAAASGANSDITSLTGLTTALSVDQGGTGASTLTGVLRGNGTTALTAATAGTDYVAPNVATTFTALQTFSGTSSVLAAVFNDAAEVVTVSATAATGTIAYDITTQSVLFYTANASANWTVNFRASSGTSLNTALATGQSVTAAFLVTQGATAFFNSAVQVDGTASGVTTRWQGGTAPSAGNASGVDVYVYTIIKTASATYSVFASQTRFA